ncbi:MAG: UDP-glucose/GDP-mannose dehydrogenase family protein [Candidatus Omnitrophica bacterium]|nr:UDP-glucose/GDP-mannose dehydrogenase family protein [Candidatus Omnitrophota bacterium]MDD4013307.1 UDP-glucose/GDP-mannose dehydrogenase family protein [Candidatus Omnitrophota bacterium]
MKITIIGSGYVGLVTGACFADLGNTVICADNDEKKIDMLGRGEIPIYEPGLEELVKKNKAKGRLVFTTDVKKATRDSTVIFVCVGTPPREDGSADLTGIEKVSRTVAESMDAYKLIVEKSTVPVETGEWVKDTINRFKTNDCDFDVASNPEFLREGSAIKDFMNPDRVVIGVESEKAGEILKALYEPLNTKIVVTSIKGAEIIKHASNSFLATKISFINAVSNICEKVGADVTSVAEGIGLDRRINTHFLKAGIGFGGSCFPKDLKAFIHISEKLGYKFDLLKEVDRINEMQKDLLMEKIARLVWNIRDKEIAVWGLAFKPDTDDIRSAPAIDVIRRLVKEGARIRVFDPAAMERSMEELKVEGIKWCKDIYETSDGADCVILMTEWNEFKEVDWDKLKKILRQPVIIDGRNLYDPGKLKAMGFRYAGIGRN